MKLRYLEWETIATCDKKQGRVILRHYPTGLFVFRDFDNYLRHSTRREMEQEMQKEIEEKVNNHETVDPHIS